MGGLFGNMKTFLNISICVESEAPLDELIADIRRDCEYMWEDKHVVVLNCMWDRSQALNFVRGQTGPAELLPSRGEVSANGADHNRLPADVTAVLERYALTLPKSSLKKGAPEWRVPKRSCYGEVNGLPNLRGKLILTNGIIAYIVREDGKWADVHFDWFIPDEEDKEAVPYEKRVKKREVDLAEFEGF